ncbi:hypothetical protein O7626_03345 [Micromonospora sp. WMMD1102]|uniref:hypothetical protein n=1 Tax=Micromonospora sp. WMMD1102 TaxID=3016105 RepID=UPI0024153322|nr:hypothetical protein [Micromonospora sp. WMMD1102]MDG4784975.1 hypothetical protein [Micromonospora sp. WMMD1102]
MKPAMYAHSKIGMKHPEPPQSAALTAESDHGQDPVRGRLSEHRRGMLAHERKMEVRNARVVRTWPRGTRLIGSDGSRSKSSKEFWAALGGIAAVAGVVVAIIVPIIEAKSGETTAKSGDGAVAPQASIATTQSKHTEAAGEPTASVTSPPSTASVAVRQSLPLKLDEAITFRWCEPDDDGGSIWFTRSPRLVGKLHNNSFGCQFNGPGVYGWVDFLVPEGYSTIRGLVAFDDASENTTARVECSILKVDGSAIFKRTLKYMQPAAIAATIEAGSRIRLHVRLVDYRADLGEAPARVFWANMRFEA